MSTQQVEAYKAQHSSYSAKYPKPESWSKPTEYPGLKGSVFRDWLGKGVLNLGLLDPQTAKPAGKKLKAAIWRNIVKLLIEAKGGTVYVSDPEWTLKGLYPKGYITGALEGDLGEALGLLFDTDDVHVQVKKIMKVPKLGGWGWTIEAKWLKKLIN